MGIRNGYYYNSSLPTTVIGTERYQRWLSRRPDSVLTADTALKFEAAVLPDGAVWTIKDYGPLYIPGAGDTIRLTENNIFLYGRLIEYESGDMPDADSVSCHTFRSNYCFLAGDNVLNSMDSRYIGLIPEDYIVGIVSGI